MVSERSTFMSSLDRERARTTDRLISLSPFSPGIVDDGTRSDRADRGLSVHGHVWEHSTGDDRRDK